MNYVQLYQAIQDYSENTESLFVANISTFVQEAEERIYNSVQIPALRKNVSGNFSINSPYLNTPDDYLSTYSLAVVDGNGNYSYLLNKDVNFIREAYPNPSSTGLPKYYGLFGSQYSNVNELSFIVGPTPDSQYQAELHYFYYPPTIVQGEISTITLTNGGTGYTSGTYEDVAVTGGSGQNAFATVTVTSGVVTNVSIKSGGQFYVVGNVLSIANSSIGGTGTNLSFTVSSVSNSTGTSWLGDNFDPVLLYGAMREAMLFMKGEADLVGYYEQKYAEALGMLKRLGDGLERGDAYRDGQTKLQYNKL